MALDRSGSPLCLPAGCMDCLLPAATQRVCRRLYRGRATNPWDNCFVGTASCACSVGQLFRRDSALCLSGAIERTLHENTRSVTKHYKQNWCIYLHIRQEVWKYHESKPISRCGARMSRHALIKTVATSMENVDAVEWKDRRTGFKLL